MKKRNAQRGFTYLVLLFAIAILGIGLAKTGVIASAQAKRQKVKELEFIRGQFAGAIESYYNNSAGEIKQYPRSVEDLVQDSRFLFVRRHLRKVYRDPFSLSLKWGLVPAPEGGFMGVYSLDASQAQTVQEQMRFVFLPAARAGKP